MHSLTNIKSDRRVSDSTISHDEFNAAEHVDDCVDDCGQGHTTTARVYY